MRSTLRSTLASSILAPCLLAACSSSAPTASPDDALSDVSADALTDAPSDASADALSDAADTHVDKAAACTTTDKLGTLLTQGHGRADGLVTAIVPTGDQACLASANSTHMTLEISMHGTLERLVVRTLDNRTTAGTMWFATKHAPLVGDAWAEGWHPGAASGLDYVKNLGVHAADFAPFASADLVAAVSAPIEIGDRVSVYAMSDFTSGDPLDGTRAHDVHRYVAGGADVDGAIVLHPDTDPTYLLFYYDGEKSF